VKKKARNYGGSCQKQKGNYKITAIMFGNIVGKRIVIAVVNVGLKNMNKDWCNTNSDTKELMNKWLSLNK